MMGPEPFAIAVWNAPATYEYQAGLQCNCGDCCDDQLHYLPNLFARVGILAMEHIAVGLGDSLVCKQMPWKAESFQCN